jgi:hypothetical protein
MDRISISPGSATKSETRDKPSSQENGNLQTCPLERWCQLKSYGREGQRVAASVLTTTGPDIKLPIEDLFAELDAPVDFSDN